MKNRVIALSAIVLAASAARAVAAQEQTAPTVNVYRVLQIVDEKPTTVVQGMFRVEPALFGGASCDYTAEVQVKDSRGKSLIKPDEPIKWDSRCPTQNGTTLPGLEMFKIGLAGGETYTVDVSVYAKDKPKEKHVRSLKVSALPDKALVSDLILARKVGLKDSADSAQWNMRIGNVGLLTASEIVVESATPEISYYVELYPRVGQTLSGTVFGVVRRLDGTEIARFPLKKLEAVSSYNPIAGTANLAGLESGQYNFDVMLALGDTTITRTQPFTMLSQVVATTSGAAAPGFFTNVSDEDMENKYGSAAVWLTQKAQAEVYQNLSPAGKREYLNRLFGPEIPNTTDGKETSSLDAFVTRSEVVQRRFGERAGRGSQPGWKTDRGRIYMLHGEPNSTISRPSPRSGNPYEIFFYQMGKGEAYLFGDETRMGHYRLVWSNSTNEQGKANGLMDIGQEAQEDLQRLGIRVKQ